MKRRFRFPLRWLAYLLLLSLLATGISFSRYRTTVAGSATVSVARPVVEYVPHPEAATLNGHPASWSGNVLAGLKPGDTLIFPFSVTNHTGAVQNEVSMKYTITVPPAANLPFSFAVYALDSNGNIVSTYIPGTEVSIGYGSPQEHKYKLYVSWDQQQNSADYWNKTQLVDIVINAVQVNN